MDSNSLILTFTVDNFKPTPDQHIILYYPEAQSKEKFISYLNTQYNLALKSFAAEEEIPSLLWPYKDFWINFHFIPVSYKGNVYFNLKSKTAALIKKLKSSDFHLDLSFTPDDYVSVIQAVVVGVYLGQGENQAYKSTAQKKHPTSIQVFHQSLPASRLSAYLAQASHLGSTTLMVCNLVNGPANIITPAYMIREIQELCKSLDIKCTVLNKSALTQQGFHALLAVGQGSEQEPYLVIMEYRHSSEAPTIGLAGKGVTFDTGGVSIKDAQNLHYMKTDMAGAAAALGATVLAARDKLPVNLTTVLPLCENSIGSRAFKPGDIIKSYSGKTIEIINTDAEGRLILADALSFLCTNFQPQFLLDIATLTGACVRALGYHAAGLFTNNNQLADAMESAGHISGELLWRLPLWEQYRPSLDSALADVKNLDDVPVAGAISAAKFLEYFTNNHPNYVHLDIAGVAFKSVDWSKEKTSTAFGVNLLWHWMNNLISSDENVS